VTSLTWLHLSDFHFKAPPADQPKAEWRFDRVAKALARDLPRLLADAKLEPDMVMVTGDIAQSGKAAEYALAAEYFQTLAGILGLAPKERWFLVPGNHDVDRDLVKGFDKRLRSLLDEANAHDLLDHSKTWSQFAARQAAFFAFAQDFLGEARVWEPSQPWRVERFDHHGHEIAVLCLNSAWACQDDQDSRKIMLGEQQVEWALREADEAKPAIKLALMHHPLTDLAELDEIACGDLLRSARGCRFLLHGHLHRTSLEQIVDPGGAWLKLAAGACYEKKARARYPHACNAVTLDLDNGSGAVHVWSYSPNGGGVWKADDTLYPGLLNNGRWDFGPNGPQKAREPENGDPPPVSKQDWVPPKYRAFIEEECRNLDPLLAGEKRIAFRLTDVYEPLQTDWRPPASRKKAAAARAELKKQSEKTRHDRALEMAAESGMALADLLKLNDHRHFVVVGEPGGGKSTFVNYAALTTLRTTAARLPIRLELKKLGSWLEKQDGEKGAMLLRWAGACLDDYGLNREALLARSGKGRLLWLLDGLDEIFDPAVRERAARIIGNWFRFGEGKADRVLTMTRPHALDDSQILKALQMPDQRANILPLGPTGQRRFLTKWFMAVHDGAKTKATAQRDALLSGLARHQELQKLKRTPLLLSMIAAVFYQGHSLPERRAELYRKAIDDLIERRFGPYSAGGSNALARRVWHALTAVARAMTEAGVAREDGQAGFGEREFRECLETGFFKDLPELDKRANVDELIRKLASHSGLLRLHGDPIRYGFAHLGFQEYLTAASFANERDPIGALAERLDQGAWREAVLLTAGCLSESSLGRLGEDFVRRLLERAGRDAHACARLELALAAALEAPEGSLPEPLLTGLRDESVKALARQRPAAGEVSRAALGLALGRLGDPRLGMAKPDRWVRFAPGEFTMGSETHGDDDNRPAHRVALSRGFWLGRYPVTNQEYGEFVADGGYCRREWWSEEAWGWLGLKDSAFDAWYQQLKRNNTFISTKSVVTPGSEPRFWDDPRFNGPNQPAVGVNWHEAQAYCNWLTARMAQNPPPFWPERGQVRLPSEAEWEYAARGDAERIYPWGDGPPDGQRANFNREGSLGVTSAIGVYPAGATPQGLYDMAGNVREWCADPWNGKAYRDRQDTTPDPLAEGDPIRRALRGGSWDYSADRLPAAYRNWNWSWDRDVSVGFRVLCAAVAAEHD